MERSTIKTRVFLSPESNRLIGNYDHGAETVIVVLDSSIAAFSVELPPLSVNEVTTFVFYNLPNTGNGNNITITATSIDNTETSEIVAPFKVIGFVDNLKGTYLTAGDKYLTNHIIFDTDPTGVPDVTGTLYYDNKDNTLSVVLVNSTLQIGQEMYIVIVNKTGSTITNGQVVYINGAQGNRPTGALASNAVYNNATRTIGVATHDIANNAVGMITTDGLVRDLDTSSYSEGDIVYLDSVPGGYTSVLPADGAARLKVGVVTKSHAVDGFICIKIDNDKYMFGDVDNDNYTYFEADGTMVMVGDATVWEDLNFDVIRSGGPAAFRPNDVTINNVYYKEFTNSNNQTCGAEEEIPHNAKLGENFYPHAHGFLKTGESSGTTGVTIRLYWELRQSTGTTNGSVDVSVTSAQLAANGNKVDFFNTYFTGSTELGAQLAMRLDRIAGDAGDMIFTTYGIHYKIDMVGSRTATAK